MRCENMVVIMGYLGRDAETNYTPSGDAVTNFSVATTETWKDKATGEKKEKTEWHRCTLWRAEKIAQYLTKGQPVYLKGKLQTREYEKDGTKRYATEIVVRDVSLLNRGQRNDPPPPGDEDSPAPSGGIEDDVPF